MGYVQCSRIAIDSAYSFTFYLYNNLHCLVSSGVCSHLLCTARPSSTESMPVRTTEPPRNPWDYIAKLVAIGDSGCGKSSLTVRLCENRFSATHDVTIGVEFGSRIVPVGPPANKALE